MTSRSLERNLQLILAHRACTSSFVYLVVFVLFTRERFGISGVLEIAALTYLFIVALEVPSGWMSDRLGRVLTLRIAACSFVIAQICYLAVDDQFALVIVGVFFVSAGHAFLSGTDVSFHYDTLEALDRGDEYAESQSKVAALGFWVRAVSALVGGLVGLIDLRLTFAISLGIAIVQLAVTCLFVEPPQRGALADGFIRQLGKCVGYLRNGFMGWIFFYGIALVVLEHVAFTVMQPWLTEALDKSPDELGATPLVSGVLFAAVAVFGALAARQSAMLGNRFGTIPTLIGIGVVSAVIVTGMALSFSLLILGLMALRSVQSAIAPVLISAAVAPRTEQRHRATLLSINSLAGRLVYGTMLWVLSVDAEDDPLPFLRIMSVISWGLIVVLLATGSWASRRQ